jgi:hypothetical protein
MNIMSERAQIYTIWSALVLMGIMGVIWVFLLQMIPPPSPALSAEETAAFYLANSSEILWGATIASWVSAFMVPFGTVLAIQLARLEEGVPAWSILAFAGGILMSMFLVFPPLLWGVAAFSADRAPELTMLVNEMANLTLVTTDQFFIFQMFPAAFVILTSKKQDALSAFPRWSGYFILWVGVAFEVGALGFLFKTGPFAWDGLLVFWMPFALFFLWVPVVSYLMLTALKRQIAAKQAQ